MSFRPPRFTIRTLMFAVAIVAVILGLYELDYVWERFSLLAYVVVTSLWWWAFRGRRRPAALCLGIAASLGHLIAFLSSIYRPDFGVIAFTLLWIILAVPLVLGAGSAWAVEATTRRASRRRSPVWVWPLIFGLAISPLTMLITRWPLRLAFQLSRSALDRLAERVAADQPIPGGTWAGLIYIIGSDIDLASGNVGLILETNSSGRTGLVRRYPGASPAQYTGPLNYNLRQVTKLNERWSLQIED